MLFILETTLYSYNCIFTYLGFINKKLKSLFLFSLIYNILLKTIFLIINTTDLLTNTLQKVINGLLEKESLFLYNIVALYYVLINFKISNRLLERLIVSYLGILTIDLLYNNIILVNNINYYWYYNEKRSLSRDLINGLFFIHPLFFFYLSTILLNYTINLIYFSLDFKENSLLKSKINFKIEENISFNYILLMIIIVISLLITGGWWAEQEINWNGYWSWDNVEVISYLQLLLLLYSSHYRIFNKENSDNYIINLFIITILFSIFLRYDLLITRHSFLIKEEALQFIIYGVIVSYILLIELYIASKIFNGKLENFKYSMNYPLISLNINSIKFFTLFHILNYYFLINVFIIYYIKYLYFIKFTVQDNHGISYSTLLILFLIFNTQIRLNKNNNFSAVPLSSITNDYNEFKYNLLDSLYIEFIHTLLLLFFIQLIILNTLNLISSPIFFSEVDPYRKYYINEVSIQYKYSKFYIGMLNSNIFEKNMLNPINNYFFIKKNPLSIEGVKNQLYSLYISNTLFLRINNIIGYNSIGVNLIKNDIILLFLNIILILIIYSYFKVPHKNIFYNKYINLNNFKKKNIKNRRPYTYL